MSLSQSFYSKLNAKPQTSNIKPERKSKPYLLFNELIINPEPYEGRDSLVNRPTKSEEYQRPVNPRSSFYRCKQAKFDTPFEKLPYLIIRRVAYRDQDKVNDEGKTIYNDTEYKNRDQIITEFHCYTLLQRCLRFVQMEAFIHQNTRCSDDKRLFYQQLKIPDRRAQGIRNVMFILEEMNQGSLTEHINRINQKKQDPFTENQVIEYTCQIAQGLKELRIRGIIHRDMRPENILFHEKQIKISDFDSAFIKGYSDYRAIRSGLQMKDTTPMEVMELIALPEQTLKQMTSQELWQKQKQADIYFLGVNVYTMVFSHPFESFNGGKILNNLINIKKRNGFCPKLLDIMVRCLEKDVHKRISMDELLIKLGEIELDKFYNDNTYTRVYIANDPLNLYTFSSTQMDKKLELEAGDFRSYKKVINTKEMAETWELLYREGTVQRNTKYNEPFHHFCLQGYDKENDNNLWYPTPSRILEQTECRKLNQIVEQGLQRIQIKTYYFELIYRMMFQVNLDRLTIQAEGYYADNIQFHLDLLTNELVVILDFLYGMIIKCPFTNDPHFILKDIGYEAERVLINMRTLYARQSFFIGRKKAVTSFFNVEEMNKKLEEFKAQHGNERPGDVEQIQQGVKFVVKNVRKVAAMQKLMEDFNSTQYESLERRKAYWYQYSNLMRYLDRIEKIVKDEMVQTIINLIISYEKMKTSKRGQDPTLKNAIFMLMILEAQNTNNLYKNDLVIIKEELTRLVGLHVGWKSEELEAYFANFTQVHEEQVAQGLHELQSQAVLRGGSALNIDYEDIDDPKEEDKQDYEFKVEMTPPPPPVSNQRSRTAVEDQQQPKMKIKVSIEDQKEKEGNVSFLVEEGMVEDMIELEEDDNNVPEIKVINPRPPSNKKSEHMERSQTFEFQFQENNIAGSNNSNNNRSSIPVENFQDLDA